MGERGRRKHAAKQRARPLVVGQERVVKRSNEIFCGRSLARAGSGLRRDKPRWHVAWEEWEGRGQGPAKEKNMHHVGKRTRANFLGGLTADPLPFSTGSRS